MKLQTMWLKEHNFFQDLSGIRIVGILLENLVDLVSKHRKCILTTHELKCCEPCRTFVKVRVFFFSSPGRLGFAQTFSFSQTPSRVCIRLCKHGKRYIFLKYNVRSCWVTCHDSTNHAREEIFDGL